MTLSEIERLAALANRACAAVIERPGDKADRQSLFDALKPLVSQAFIDGHDPQPPQVRALFRQTAVLAEIVRSRVEYSQTGRRSDDFEAMHIGNGAREVRRVLSALVDAIGTGRNV
jgi:hypothetical protein